MRFDPAYRREGRAYDGARLVAKDRTLPEEVAVALVFDGSTLAVMMASPTDVRDFAYGFALTEGVIPAPSDVESFEIVEHEQGIEARFWLRAKPGAALTERRRHFAGPTGCGLCGIDSLSEALRDVPEVRSDLVMRSADIAAAPDALRARQPLHDDTRAVHAAGFFTAEDGMILVREDVGRHNALDKLIGAVRLAEVDPARGAMVVTSRLSVELVQKAAMAGCPVIVAVSVPTTAALRLAEEAGITVAACARGGGFELFTHSERIREARG